MLTRDYVQDPSGPTPDKRQSKDEEPKGKEPKDEEPKDDEPEEEEEEEEEDMVDPKDKFEEGELLSFYNRLHVRQSREIARSTNHTIVFEFLCGH